MRDFNSVLMISETGSSFIMNSIKNALVAQGINAISEPASIADIAAIENMPALALIASGDFVEEHQEMLMYLKEHFNGTTKFVLVGTADENNRLKRVFSSSLIAGEFIRPFDNSEAVNKVKELLGLLAKSDEMKTVLVVDDSGMMLRTIMGWLNGKYKVNLANSATSALTSIAKSKPDLILLDYEMPVCSGAQMFSMLRSEADTKDIPVIFLTSKSDADTVREVAALGPEGYLLKTTPSTQVIATIDNFFASRTV